MYISKNEAIYIHIPFCSKICVYCDFCKMYYKEEWVNKYLEALEKEIIENYKGENIKTIYIGGGTPSCLNMNQLNKLFQIINVFSINNLEEFTIECNIEDISEEKLKLFKDNKVNRLSVGVQSFNEKILGFLNRQIDRNKIIENILLAKKCFDNINIDLIYGIKGQTIDEVKSDLKEYLKLDLPHISIYGLIKENNTVLSASNYQEADDDLFYEMYKLINDTLKNNNYIHYEISNYAKAGYQSKHNLVYWNNDKYYGFGLGASGYLDDYRYDNTRSLNKYLNGNYISNKKTVTIKTDMENEMILGLRKLEGVSNIKFFNKFGKNIEDVFDTSKLVKNKEKYYISEDNIYISNSILINFLLD